MPDLKPYNDSFGYATVGYGRLLHKSNVTKVDIEKYKDYTVEKADADFENDLQSEGTEPVRKYVKVKLTQCQFDALVDFSYNSGMTSFHNSNLLIAINKEETDPQVMNKYFHQFNTVPWRKEDEANMYNFGYYNVKVASGSSKPNKKSNKKAGKKPKK